MKTYPMSIEQRAWHVFIVRQRNWKLWAYWLRTQAADLTRGYDDKVA